MVKKSTEDFKLPEAILLGLVTGVVRGYKEYLGERNDKSKMFINSAFAYTRSNYIDSYVHDALIGQPTITTKKGIAGVAWEYLQAVHQNGGAKSLIITKGARIAKNNFPGDSEKTPKSDYLQTFAELNRNTAKSGVLSGIKSGQPMQLELDLSGAEDLSRLIKQDADSENAQLDRFYIVTYQLDDNKVISSIKLTMPNPQTHNLAEIADLTQLIDRTGIEIDDEEYNTVRNSEFPEPEVDTQDFNFEKPNTETGTEKM